MREIDALVFEYQHDKHRPRESEALLILRKVASLVKPIMRRRDWKVGTLCEFYPHQQNLLGLNINAGQKICLRLRYASDQCQFIPIEQVVDTMLHELCHIVHGPHNQQFHALWNQLRDEHEELVTRGYTGEGFLSEGRRLGGRKMPIDEARRQARAAAERRRTLSAGSGQRLGGPPIFRGTDMRRVIADAAQRRIEVTNGCASGADNSVELADEASRNGFRTRAEEDDANEQAIMQAYIDLIEQEERERYGPSYIPPSHENPAGPRSTLSPPPVPQSTRPAGPLQPPEPVDLTSDDSLYEQPWTCAVCTLENLPNFLCCDACASERPRPQPTRTVSGPTTAHPRGTETRNKNKRPLSQTTQQNSFRNRTRAIESLAALERNASKRPLGWVCDFCGAFMETEWWTCSSCGNMKRRS
ncbi:WLM domain-containing protein [Aspergillus ambiguus]|uniref:metalloendopeptidase WSS1 n=1 Tax=Aspergillus ambiguus TaxID=176160 RepID=UPI003CCCB738